MFSTECTKIRQNQVVDFDGLWGVIMVKQPEKMDPAKLCLS